jgi:NAD(P)-dependent dehydrogenase (short-subunit alcohol dehydrogenase family)
VDLLFNNAGVTAPAAPLDELPVEHVTAVINANLLGAILCAREAMRIMKTQAPQGGRIINNGSVSAYAPRPNSAPYTAAKHGMTGLTKSIILDGRAFNISCSQIDIGNALTDMTSEMAFGVPQADGSMRAEPRMDVSRVARMVVHMAQLPNEANAAFVTLMAANMPLYGRG